MYSFSEYIYGTIGTKTYVVMCNMFLVTGIAIKYDSEMYFFFHIYSKLVQSIINYCNK